MSQKDSVTLFYACATPSARPAATAGSLDVPAMSLQGEVFCNITGGGGTVTADVQDPSYSPGDFIPGLIQGLDVNNFNRYYSQDLQAWAAGEVFAYAGSLDPINLDAGTDGIHYVQSVQSFTYLYDATAAPSQLARPAVQLPSDSDAQAAAQNGLAGVVARLQIFNGATWDRIKSATAAVLSALSSAGALLTTKPGEWAVNHTPAANTQATITRAAGAAGVRHVCTSISATLIGLAASAETTVLVNLRDGASGAGTILQSWRLLVTGTTGSETGIALTGLNIPGSAATAMTLEFATAGGADTFETVAMTGYDAS